VVLDLFLFSKIIDWDLKKILPSRSTRQRVPFVPIFPGQSLFYDFQRVLSWCRYKIRFGAPNGPGFFLVTQNITFLTTRTNLLHFPPRQKTC
jgi:hypothetical protein